MKRIVAILLVLILAFTVTGCAENSNQHEGEAKTPSGSSIQKGRDYQDVIDDFSQKGFTNIKTETIDDLIFGWLTKDGEVEEVSVGGDVDYSPDDWVAADTEVIIKYHTFPSTEAEKTPDVSATQDTAEVLNTPEAPEILEATETVTLLAEPLDLNAINNTNSSESDAQFVGKYYEVTGVVEQTVAPSDGYNAMIIIEPDVMAKGMGLTLPLEINIWLSADEFEKIGGIESVGKLIVISVKLTSISRNAISDDPDIKGYPIQLEFGNYN